MTENTALIEDYRITSYCGLVGVAMYGALLVAQQGVDKFQCAEHGVHL